MEAYNTLLGQQFKDRINDVKKTIDEQLALGDPEVLTPYSEHITLAGRDNDRAAVWIHPFMYNGTVYADPRAYYSNSGGIRNKPEYQFLLQRAQIEYLWETQPAAFESVMGTVATVYGQWISSGLAARFALPPTDGVIIKILATAYYVGKCLSKIDGRDVKVDTIKQQTVRLLSARGGWVPAETVNDVLNSEDVTHWLSHDQDNLRIMMALIAEHVSTTVTGLSHHTLVQIMSAGSWLGDNNIALAALALEHVPTLTLMIGVTEISTMHRNKTRIGRTVAGLSRSINAKAVGSFIKGLSDADTPIKG